MGATSYRKGISSKMPEHESQAITLCDGTEVIIRHIRPEDAARLQALFARLSPESIFFRFLGLRKELPDKEAEQLAGVDQQSRMAFVATVQQNGQEIVAVARYAAIPETWPLEAEAAIVVQDSYQGRGLGTILMGRLATYARTQGIHAFRATVHQGNARIMRFIQRSGLPTRSRVEPGGLEIWIGLGPDRHPGDGGSSGVAEAEISHARRATRCLCAIA
jgi:RimJ/RimL family protein N-acetyltransferase